MSVVEFNIAELEASIYRTERGVTLAEEVEDLSGSLRLFVQHAWHTVWPNERYVHGWHIDAICEHLEAVTDGEIRRLQVWVPPGTMKSTAVSIMWPAWEWANLPHLRYITASYDQDLATGFAVRSRELIKSPWYQARWPHVQLKRDQDLKRSYANTSGGERLATSVGGQGTGKHGHRIIIDDPLNAREIVSEAKLLEVADWHDGTISTRFADPKTSAEVIIQQRLSERDLAGHVLEQSSDWTVLCLPERYEAQHPFAWRGDPRTTEGELLWPERIGPDEHAARASTLGSYRAAGQLQQRPAAREGAILKRRLWRWYVPQQPDETDEEFVARLPRFTEIVQSWDTTFKDAAQNDKVAGTVWGKIGADLYLLPEGRHTRLNLSGTKTAIRDLHRWVEERWPRAAHRILVEKTANGPEVIAELQRELRGIIPTRPSVGADKPAVSKVVRAEAVEPALEGGNIFLPGYADTTAPQGYDIARTPELAAELVEECAAFPFGAHDDLVDSFTQAVNWTRVRPIGSASLGKIRGQRPEVGSLAVAADRRG